MLKTTHNYQLTASLGQESGSGSSLLQSPWYQLGLWSPPGLIEEGAMPKLTLVLAEFGSLWIVRLRAPVPCWGLALAKPAAPGHVGLFHTIAFFITVYKPRRQQREHQRNGSHGLL